MTMVLSNSICKAKNPLPVEETAADSRKLNKVVWAGLIFTLIICIGVGVTLFTGSVTTAFHEQELNIAVTYWQDKTIAYKDIKSVALQDNIEPGKRTYGLGSPKLLAGRFKNTQFGDYLLYAYTKCNEYIVLETKDGIIVLNGETPEDTNKIYENLVLNLELSLQ